jgi:proteic killer suppression protein
MVFKGGQMIKSFKCKETEKIFNGEYSKKFPTNIQERAMRKLVMISASQTISDLRIPPSNRLESLAGNRNGQWSIRVNEQYRICFEWQENEASNVEIVDYHK